MQSHGPFPTSNPTVQDSHPYYPTQPPAQVRNDSTVSSTESEHTIAQDLSEALGQLKIEEIGIGKSMSSDEVPANDGLLSTLHKAAWKERHRT